MLNVSSYGADSGLSCLVIINVIVFSSATVTPPLDFNVLQYNLLIVVQSMIHLHLHRRKSVYYFMHQNQQWLFSAILNLNDPEIPAYNVLLGFHLDDKLP